MGGIFYTDEGSSSERDLISIGERVSMGGIPPLIYNSPSGSINITLGSGIVQFEADSSQILSVTPGAMTRVNFPLEHFPDNNFKFDAGTDNFRGSGIRIFSPGLYRCAYNIAVEKTAGTSSRDYIAQARLQVSPRNDGVLIRPSTSFTQTGSLTLPASSLSAVFLFNARAGDLLAIEIGFRSLFSASQTARTVINGTWLVIERIGPPR